nr:MAG TPA: hypothetical protein [Caudoviricetes sp.]
MLGQHLFLLTSRLAVSYTASDTACKSKSSTY